MVIARNPSSKVFSQSSVKRRPRISLKRSRVMTKSSSSSSTRSTFTRDESKNVVSFAIGQLHSLQPVLRQQAHEFDQRFEFDRFRDKGIGAEFVHFIDVGIGFGGGQNDDRDALEIAAIFHLAQNFASIFPGHVQIQEDQAGA